MIPLEDNASDIIGKAQHGLRISDTELAEKARVSSQKIRKLRDGEFDELALLRVAPVLGLAARALSELARDEWHPKKIDEREGLAQFHTQYHGMGVNAYLVWDPAIRAAAAFDTGADCSEMVRIAKREKLNLKLILLTHAHSDHVADLPRLREETGAQVFAPALRQINEGKRFAGSIGSTRLGIWRHTCERFVSIVRIRNSMRWKRSYDDTLRNNLES
jgi:hypothetical protein